MGDQDQCNAGCDDVLTAQEGWRALLKLRQRMNLNPGLASSLSYREFTVALDGLISRVGCEKEEARLAALKAAQISHRQGLRNHSERLDSHRRVMDEIEERQAKRDHGVEMLGVKVDELAERLNVTRATVRQASHWLQEHQERTPHPTAQIPDSTLRRHVDTLAAQGRSALAEQAKVIDTLAQNLGCLEMHLGLRPKSPPKPGDVEFVEREADKTPEEVFVVRVRAILAACNEGRVTGGYGIGKINEALREMAL